MGHKASHHNMTKIRFDGAPATRKIAEKRLSVTQPRRTCWRGSESTYGKFCRSFSHHRAPCGDRQRYGTQCSYAVFICGIYKGGGGHVIRAFNALKNISDVRAVRIRPNPMNDLLAERLIREINRLSEQQ